MGRLVPESPRARRRLAWTSAALVAACGVAGIFVLIPSHGPPNANPTRYEGAAQLAGNGPSRHLSTADRRAIDATLDAFVPAGMERHDPARAWTLAGPELRASSPLAAWRRGNSPIPYVIPKEKTFHHWQTSYVEKGYVGFTLLLHPVNQKLATSYVYSGQMVERHGTWLVNRLYTIAIMKPPTHAGPQEVGPADFAAPPAQATGPPSKAHLGGLGILPAVAIFALVLLIPVAVAVGAFVRARRWRRKVRAGGRTALPPLPSGYAHSTEDERAPVGKR